VMQEPFYCDEGPPSQEVMQEVFYRP